ncbi:Uncharacterized protein FWK35_00035381 [Aphis craccivora]|uniref:Uncharacterized protein n=1 Tax=Aphis craccivora TaxID=307492 RepID=A0A6G0YIP4_APHCR|nr:Uncharacterized protein FWK35_00035381 [Aphis craccivora]
MFIIVFSSVDKIFLAQSKYLKIIVYALLPNKKKENIYAFVAKSKNIKLQLKTKNGHVDYVVRYFEYLVDTPFYRELESDLSRLLDYFEETWVGKMDWNGKRKNPKFSITIWNCYVDEYNLPKTNNSLEEWHNAKS